MYGVFSWWIWGEDRGRAFLVLGCAVAMLEKQAKGKWLKAKGGRSRCAQSGLDAVR